MLLLQTAFQDGLTIFVLMAVAAILAGLIVYLLMRSRSKDCEEARARLEEKYQAQLLEIQDLSGLRVANEDLTKANADLKAEINRLKAQLANANKATKEAEAHAEQSEKEKADILARIEARASQLNFDRIGLASIEEKDDLKRIKGIGPFIEEKLNALKIFTFRQIANFDDDDEEMVNEAIEFFPGRVKRDAWVLQAKGFLGDKSAAEQAELIRLSHRAHEINFEKIGLASADNKDDLKEISGIGPFIEKKLNSLKIYTFEQISRFDKEDVEKVTEIIEFFPGRIERDEWIKQAKEFVKEKKS